MIDIPTKNGVMGLQYNGANEEIKLFVDVDGRQLTAKLEIASARQLADLLARLAYYGAEAHNSAQASCRLLALHEDAATNVASTPIDDTDGPFVDDINETHHPDIRPSMDTKMH